MNRFKSLTINLDGIQDDKNNDEIVILLRNAINSFPKIDKI